MACWNGITIMDGKNYSKEITQKRKEISRIASRIGLKNDIMVSLLARNCDDYENNMKYQPFYQNIEKEGMKIYG